MLPPHGMTAFAAWAPFKDVEEASDGREVRLLASSPSPATTVPECIEPPCHPEPHPMWGILELVEIVIAYAIQGALPPLQPPPRGTELPFPDKTDTARLRLVNRIFRNGATPFLYKSLRIGGAARRALDASILQHPPAALGTYVTKVQARVCDRHDHLITTALIRRMTSLEDLSFHIGYSGASLPRAERPLLSYLPKLRHLHLAETSGIDSEYLPQELGKPVETIEVFARIWSANTLRYVQSLGDLVTALMLIGPPPPLSINARHASTLDWQTMLRAMTSLRIIVSDKHRMNLASLETLPKSLHHVDIDMQHTRSGQEGSLRLLANPTWLPNLVSKPRFYLDACELIRREPSLYQDVRELARLSEIARIARKWEV